jgi:hypothetical protein
MNALEILAMAAEAASHRDIDTVEDCFDMIAELNLGGDEGLLAGTVLYYLARTADGA